MTVAYCVEIDRLVLDGFALTPAEAELVRREVATQLRLLLGAAPQPPTIAGSGAYQQRVTAQPLSTWETSGSQAPMLAAELAQRIAGSVRAGVLDASSNPASRAPERPME